MVSLKKNLQSNNKNDNTTEIFPEREDLYYEWKYSQKWTLTLLYLKIQLVSQGKK